MQSFDAAHFILTADRRDYRVTKMTAISTALRHSTGQGVLPTLNKTVKDMRRQETISSSQ
jgi:hypothetical protein